MPVPWWVLALIIFGAPLVFAAALCFQAWRAFREEDRQRQDADVIPFGSARSTPRPHADVSLRATLDAQRSNPRRPGRAERRGL